MKNLTASTSLFLFGILVTLTTSFVHGQSFTKKYLIQDGLPSQEIYDIHQDKNGLIWVACDRGIASFNGSEFTNYGPIDGIPSNMVFEFFEQTDGTIWCTTKELQLFYFHPDTLIFHNFKYNDKLYRVYKDKIRKAEPRALQVGKDGSVKFRTLWTPGVVYVSGDGKLVFNESNLRISNYRKPMKLVTDRFGYPHLRFARGDVAEVFEGFESSSRQHILELEDAYVWSSEEVYIILAKDNLERIAYTNYGDLPVILNTGLNDGNGLKGFWIGLTHGGVKIFDQQGKLKNHLAKEYSVTSYFEDSEGGIWIGTHGSGLLYYSKSKLKIVQASLNTEIYSLSIDEEGRLIYMTNEHLLFRVKENMKNVFWKGVGWHDIVGQYYFSNETYYDRMVNPIWEGEPCTRYSDNRNELPLFIFGGNVFDHNLTSLMSTRGTAQRMSDAEHIGNAIVVANEKNLIVIDRNGKELRRKNLGVEIVEIDVHDNQIYCATKGKGVIILDRNLSIIEEINTSNGALSNYIFEVMIKGGSLWIASTKGLCKVSERSNGNWRLENLTMKEGLLDQEVRDIEIIGKRVYLATRGGVCYFEEDDWKEIINGKTRVYFKKTGILVNGVPRKDFLNLSHDQNRLEIEYDLITFTNVRKLNFRYKLLGFNDDWQVTAERRIVYNSLPPGKYELVVQPLINGNTREKVFREKIEIHPAFYNQWWFHVSFWSLVILIIWLFFKYRILNYNRGVIQEILRQILRRLRSEKNQFIVRCDGREVRIVSEEVLYVESSRNYITIYTSSSRYVVRHKISDFKDLVPDPLEYIRIKRSVIVRVDKVTEKGVKAIKVDDKEFKVGKTYLENLEKIEL